MELEDSNGSPILRGAETRDRIASDPKTAGIQALDAVRQITFVPLHETCVEHGVIRGIG